MVELKSPHRGACHCGGVQFEAQFSPDALDTVRRCTCSICRMRGAVAISVELDNLTVTAGEDKLSLYQMGTMTAKHYFCSVCGIYPFHQRRSNPNHYGINVACLEGVSPFDFPEVIVWDGDRHPRDTGKTFFAGTLRFDAIDDQVGQ